MFKISKEILIIIDQSCEIDYYILIACAQEETAIEEVLVRGWQGGRGG